MEFSDLKFVRIDSPESFAQIPNYLFQQVKGRSWDVDRLDGLAPLFLSNDVHRFWMLINEKRAVKGVLWVVIDILSEKLNVIVFSIDEEYQENSLENTRDFLRQFIKDYNKAKNGITLKGKINWVTAEPELLEGIGGQRPETILIEV